MLKGLFSYIAIVGFTTVWILGWLCISWLVGAFFDLPMPTTAILGATLGPLGLVAVLILGFLSRQSNGSPAKPNTTTVVAESMNVDPFL